MLADYLRAPSSFEGQPVKSTRNQGGHAGVGMLVAWVFGHWSLPVIAILYALWEGVQWRRYGGEDWDCVEDWCFLMTGAITAAIVPLVPWPITLTQLMVLAAWLLAGYLRRADG